jgi:uncharacterized membrane protein YsdA (DUF1294 family)
MNNALTDVLPAKVRKYVYAAYTVAVTAEGIWALFGSVPDKVLGVTAAVGGALGAVAGSNVRHTPPAL